MGRFPFFFPQLHPLAQQQILQPYFSSTVTGIQFEGSTYNRLAEITKKETSWLCIYDLEIIKSGGLWMNCGIYEQSNER